jgi:predicted DNA-binding protein (MmcQ/YjbR family)
MPPRPVFDRSVFAHARTACLALPDTSETASWGHPNFRAGRRTFCTFETIGGRPSIAFKLPPDDPALRRRRDTFATPYGRGSWTSIWVDRSVTRAAIATLAERSYRAVATPRMVRALDKR